MRILLLTSDPKASDLDFLYSSSIFLTFSARYPNLTPSYLDRFEEHSAGATTWYAETPSLELFRLIFLNLHPFFSKILIFSSKTSRTLSSRPSKNSDGMPIINDLNFFVQSAA